MNTPLVSIIIPVHNSAKYLTQCLNSVVNQSYKNIEILIIDDDSSDDSSTIINKFKEQDSRIRTFKCKYGKAGLTRNVGLKEFRGDFVYFVDSDDIVDTNGVKSLINEQQNHKCDLVQCGFYYYFKDRLELDERYLKINHPSLILDSIAMYRDLLKDELINDFLWNKLFKRDIIKNVFFNDLALYEDKYFINEIIKNVTKISISPIPIYYYRQHANSLTGVPPLLNIELFKAAENRIITIIKNYPEFKKLGMNELWKRILHLCLLNNNSKNREYGVKSIIKYKDEFNNYLKNETSYQLYENNLLNILKLIVYIKRVYNHFFAKRLSRFPLPYNLEFE